MADGSDLERTEAATPRRREQARQDGEVARSAELGAAGVLLGSALVLATLGPALAAGLRAILASGLAATGSSMMSGAGAVELVRDEGWRALGLMVSWLAALAGLAAVVGAAQARGTLSAKPLAPKGERVNPLSNVRRIFGAQGAMELVKSLLKLTVVAIAVRATLRGAWSQILALPEESPLGLGAVVFRTAVRLLVTAGMCYLALAALDYLWQLWQHERRLRMTRQDVKQEMRESEGDPLVRHRMRSIGRALARRQMFRDIPGADVVITNPTHIAVALRYDPLNASAPVVVAMGQRKVAERIKAIAREAGVPLVENKPLARALMASAHVGLMIPAELYLAVAEILAFVIRRRIARGAGLREVLA